MTINNISYSSIESERFNKSIHRGFVKQIDADFIKSYLTAYNPEILILRFPVAEQCNLHKLNSLEREIIFADTLVYYEWKNPDRLECEFINDDLNFVEATKDDLNLLTDLVPSIFQDYTNHYFSNPSLDRKKIVEGYTEWAVNYVSAPAKINRIVYKKAVPVGFITCSYDAENAEIILNGVLPDYRKGGIYTDMIRFVKNYFCDRKIKIIKVSTQIQNFAVQNVWRKEGFYLNEAFITIHLNKLV